MKHLFALIGITLMYKPFWVIVLTLCILFFAGCEGGREDILTLSLYNVTLVDDEESTKGGYTKLYVSLKDPTLNVEIFPNARAALESKVWDTIWVNSVFYLVRHEKVIPQIVGFESEAERDTFVQLLSTQSAKGISWTHEFHEYISVFLMEYSGNDTVYVVEVRPIMPDLENLTPEQEILLDKAPPLLISTIPEMFSYEVADPQEIMKHGVQLTFSEDVTGDLKLNQSYAFLPEENLGWELIAKGNILTLVQGEGEPLEASTTYIVSGTVRDKNNNTTDIWYTFRTAIDVSIDITPPAIISSSPLDGEIRVDPIRLFNNGISIKFDEQITGEIRLKTEDGEDLGWLSNVENDTIKLLSIAGAELDYEASYIIVGTVRDGSGNETTVDIWFVTKSLE